MTRVRSLRPGLLGGVFPPTSFSLAPPTHFLLSYLTCAPQYPGTYLTFEVVSLVPYDRKLIDVSLLSPEQVSAPQHCLRFSLAPRLSGLSTPLPQDPLPLPLPRGSTLVVSTGTHWASLPCSPETPELLELSSQTSMSKPRQ